MQNYLEFSFKIFPPLPHESFRVAFYKKSNILNTTISSKSPFSSA